MGAASLVTFIIYSQDGDDLEPDRYILTSLFAATLFVVVFERLRGYRLSQLAIWGFVMSLSLLLVFVGKISDRYSRGWVLASIVTVASFLLIRRFIFHVILTRWVRDGSLTRNIAVVGVGNAAERIITTLQQSRDPSFAVFGVFDDRKSRLPPSISGLNILGTTDDALHDGIRWTR